MRVTAAMRMVIVVVRMLMPLVTAFRTVDMTGGGRLLSGSRQGGRLVAKAAELARDTVEVGFRPVCHRHRAGDDRNSYICHGRNAANGCLDLGRAARAIHPLHSKARLALRDRHNLHSCMSGAIPYDLEQLEDQEEISDFSVPALPCASRQYIALRLEPARCFVTVSSKASASSVMRCSFTSQEWRP